MWNCVCKLLSELCWDIYLFQQGKLECIDGSGEPESKFWIRIPWKGGGSLDWELQLSFCTSFHLQSAWASGLRYRTSAEVVSCAEGVQKKFASIQKSNLVDDCICTVQFALLESYRSVIFIGQLFPTWAVGDSLGLGHVPGGVQPRNGGTRNGHQEWHRAVLLAPPPGLAFLVCPASRECCSLAQVMLRKCSHFLSNTSNYRRCNAPYLVLLLLGSHSSSFSESKWQLLYFS